MNEDSVRIMTQYSLLQILGIWIGATLPTVFDRSIEQSGCGFYD